VEISSIVTDSRMAMLPLPRNLYLEFIKGVTKYYFSFIETMGKPELSKDLDDLYWIMFCGVPLGKVLKERHLK